MDSPPPPLPAKTRRSSHAPVIVSATRHSHTHTQPHVVKIRVNPVEPVAANCVVSQSGANTVRINISSELDDMRGSSPYYFYTSGQSSPSDTLDSGTCSDLDGSTPPPLPKKSAVTVTVSHQRGGSLTSSGADVESDDEISCDSLNSSELDGSSEGKQEEQVIEPIIQREQRVPAGVKDLDEVRERTSRVSLNSESDEIYRSSPTLEADRSSSVSTHSDKSDDHKPLEKTNSNESSSSRKSVVEERTYDDRNKHSNASVIDPDSFYKFHLNENQFDAVVPCARQDDDDLFAGCKGYQEGDLASSTIRSSKGTIRGVKNRVRAGIATFLQMHTSKVSCSLIQQIINEFFF